VNCAGVQLFASNPCLTAVTTASQTDIPTDIRLKIGKNRPKWSTVQILYDIHDWGTRTRYIYTHEMHYAPYKLPLTHEMKIPWDCRAEYEGDQLIVRCSKCLYHGKFYSRLPALPSAWQYEPWGYSGPRLIDLPSGVKKMLWNPTFYEIPEGSWHVFFTEEEIKDAKYAKDILKAWDDLYWKCMKEKTVEIPD